MKTKEELLRITQLEPITLETIFGIKLSAKEELEITNEIQSSLISMIEILKSKQVNK